MNDRELVSRRVAATLLAGVWCERALLRRAEALLGVATRKGQKALIGALVAEWQDDVPPSPDWLATFLCRTAAFDAACGGQIKNPGIVRPVLASPRFAPSPRFADLGVPRLATVGDLARWLRLGIDRLDWLADTKHQQGATDNAILQHYAYTFVAKKSGPPRVIEAPKPELKAIQRRILHEIVDLVPVHRAAHGFVAGRSCLTAARQHAGEAIVVSADLKDFFLTTRLSRVHGLFRKLGFPWSVARYLTALCSTATPESVFLRVPLEQRHDWRTRRAFATPHLPQGAPTSPALANFAAWSLDERLSGLARSVQATYTRYADDLAFSGGDALARGPGRFLETVAAIADEEGVALNEGKTRIMRRAQCQRVTGLVVNEHLNVSRAAYDDLKATLRNCVTRGPQSQNRSGSQDFRAHLLGRVGWVEQVAPARGARLRAAFDRISWD